MEDKKETNTLDKDTLAKIIDTMNKQAVQITKLLRAQQRQQNEIGNLRTKINILAGRLKG